MPTETTHTARSSQPPYDTQRQVVGPRIWVKFQRTQCMDPPFKITLDSGIQANYPGNVVKQFVCVLNIYIDFMENDLQFLFELMHFHEFNLLW